MNTEARPSLQAESGQSEVVTYCDVATREVIETSGPPVVDFGKSDIRVLYEDFHYSMDMIAPIIGIKRNNVRNRLETLGVEIRDSHISDPIANRRRSISLKKVHEKRGDDIVAKIHTPEANKNKSKAQKKKFKEDSDYRRKIRANVKKAQIAWREKAAANRKAREPALQEQKRKQRNQDIQFSRSILNSPGILFLKPRYQEVLKHRFSLDEENQLLTRKEVGKRMGGISFQAVSQLEKKALIQLWFQNVRLGYVHNVQK